MFNFHLKHFIGLVVLLIVTGFATESFAQVNDISSRRPDLPPGVCDALQVPEGNKAAFRVFARGVQIYRWNGETWEFIAPRADLFAAANFHGKVAIHYGGPIWEANNGNKVAGRRLAGCTPDPTAISWLLLKASPGDGTGIFSRVTYIQRVNTVGGLPPATPGAAIDELVESPYTTEYYFYRADR